MAHEIEALPEVGMPGNAARALPWAYKFRQIGFKRFCLLAAAIAFTGSTTLLGLFMLANHVFDMFPAVPAVYEQPGVMMVFGNLVFAPVVETVLMIALLKLFVRAGLSRLASIVLSALIWAFLHGTLAPLRFGGTIWSFFVFGYCYYLWCDRQPNRAFAAACLPHTCVNLLPTVAIFVDYYAFPGK